MKVNKIINVKSYPYVVTHYSKHLGNVLTIQNTKQINSDSLNYNPNAYLNKSIISFSGNNKLIGPIDYVELLPKLGIKVKQDEDGMLILSRYDSQVTKKYGLDENLLFANVKEIIGKASFWGSKMKSLGNLEKIGGDVTFARSDIKKLGKLREIGGDAYFASPKILSLGNLEKIGGFVNFNFSNLKSVGKLKKIGGNVALGNSGLTPQSFDNVDVKGIIFKFYRNS